VISFVRIPMSNSYFLSLYLRFEHLKTGGGKDLSQALNFREEKLKSIIQLSVDGLQSEFDDDTEAISTDNLVNGRLKLFYITK